MTTGIVPRDVNAALMEKAVIEGDLSGLTPQERVAYYGRVCESLGLNPFTKPFAYIRLNSKLVLYAQRDATDQLRNLHSISVTITSRETVGGVYVVTARAATKDGRTDESTGAVAIQGLAGEGLANAYMKAETKAKRRVTLSIVGLGWLDETEVTTIPDARVVRVDADGVIEAETQQNARTAPKPANTESTSYYGPVEPAPKGLCSHGVPYKLRTGHKADGTAYEFWSASHRLPDGKWCQDRPAKPQEPKAADVDRAAEQMEALWPDADPPAPTPAHAEPADNPNVVRPALKDALTKLAGKLGRPVPDFAAMTASEALATHSLWSNEARKGR